MCIPITPKTKIEWYLIVSIENESTLTVIRILDFMKFLKSNQ